jgi:hypothetical protein
MAVSHSSRYGLLPVAPFGGWNCNREVAMLCVFTGGGLNISPGSRRFCAGGRATRRA